MRPLLLHNRLVLARVLFPFTHGHIDNGVLLKLTL